MDPQPPPWRVFDAPVSTQTPSEPAGSQTETRQGGLSFASLALTTWLGLGAAVVMAGLAAVIAISGLPSAAADAFGSSAAVGSGATDGLGELVVDVGGAVARPGVYHLPAGSRIGDAITAAGGFGPRVAAERVAADLNLAAPLHDGDRVVVPSRDDAGTPVPGGGGTAHGSPGLVDLNHATEAELDALPGIGPVTAAKIVASREEARFTTVDELRSRGLVGQKTFDKLRPLVTVG